MSIYNNPEFICVRCLDGEVYYWGGFDVDTGLGKATMHSEGARRVHDVGFKTMSRILDAIKENGWELVNEDLTLERMAEQKLAADISAHETYLDSLDLH